MKQASESVLIVGTGSIGMRHAHVFRQAGCRVVLCPKRKPRVAELSTNWNCVEAPIDAATTHAVIATNTSEHASDAKACFHAGMKCLIEKPLTDSLDSGKSVLLHARQRNLEQNSYCAFNLRHSLSLLKFRELLQEVGEVHAVDIVCRSFLPEWRAERDYRTSYSADPKAGGVLRDLCHELDYAIWCFGMPDSLSAICSNSGRLQIRSEEQASVHYRAGNALVSIQLDYLSRPTRRYMLAYGNRGTLAWNAIEQTITLELNDEIPETRSLSQTRDEMMHYQAKAFLESDSKSMCSLHSGLKVSALIDAAYRSAENHREEQVDLTI